jgi:hypothetical protein
VVVLRRRPILPPMTRPSSTEIREVPRRTVWVRVDILPWLVLIILRGIVVDVDDASALRCAPPGCDCLEPRWASGELAVEKRSPLRRRRLSWPTEGEAEQLLIYCWIFSFAPPRAADRARLLSADAEPSSRHRG